MPHAASRGSAGFAQRPGMGPRAMLEGWRPGEEAGNSPATAGRTEENAADRARKREERRPPPAYTPAHVPSSTKINSPAGAAGAAAAAGLTAACLASFLDSSSTDASPSSSRSNTFWVCTPDIFLCWFEGERSCVCVCAGCVAGWGRPRAGCGVFWVGGVWCGRGRKWEGGASQVGGMEGVRRDTRPARFPSPLNGKKLITPALTDLPSLPTPSITPPYSLITHQCSFCNHLQKKERKLLERHSPALLLPLENSAGAAARKV